MGIYAKTEGIYLYRPKGNCNDTTTNGGDISNYRIIYHFPNMIFGTGEEYLNRGYVWRKIYLYNKTDRVIDDLYVFLIPSDPNYDYFNSNVQFYLNYGDISNIEDVEDSLDNTKSFGVFELYKIANINEDGLYLKYPSRENNISQQIDLTNHGIMLYDNDSTLVKDITKVNNVHENPNEWIFVKTENKLSQDYNPDRFIVSSGLVFRNIEVNQIFKIWLGMDYYDTTSDYVSSFRLYFSWDEISLE